MQVVTITVFSLHSLGGVAIHVSQLPSRTCGRESLRPLWVSQYNYLRRCGLYSWTLVDLTSTQHNLYVPYLQRDSRLWNLLRLHCKCYRLSTILFKKTLVCDWCSYLRACIGHARDGPPFAILAGHPGVHEHVQSYGGNGFSDLCVGASLWSAHGKRDFSFRRSNKHNTK